MLILTERAARLIDADGLKRTVEPLSELGRDARAAHRAFGPSGASAWLEDRAECLALAELDTLSRTALGRELRRAERLGGALERIVIADADVADLFRAKALVYVAHRVVTVLIESGVNRPCARLPMTLAAMMDFLRVLESEPEIRSRFVLGDAFDPALADARRTAREARELLEETTRTFRDTLEERHGIGIRFGCIRCASESVDRIAALDADRHLRSTGTDGADRVYAPVFSPEIEVLAGRCEELDAVERAHETRVVRALSLAIAPSVELLAGVESWVGRVDFALARVRLHERFGCWPTVGESLVVQDGWVPRVRATVEGASGTYQPQSISADKGVTLLSGPNMGGKTVALTLAGTIQFLAQLGYPVPATSAEFSWVERIDYIGADLSDVGAGLSSFAGEMGALAEVLAHSGPQLILVDELGRSTSPREGSALADAAISELEEMNAVSIVVTHFPALESRARVRALRVIGLANADMDVLRQTAADGGWQAALNSVMDFALTEDVGARSEPDALRIAELLGVPKSLVDRAARNLGQPDES
jgi:DNA mismatch repair ATPase MutS